MSDKIFDTRLCIIKRHKNRGRYELYIHDETFRAFVKEHPLEIPSEDLEELRVLKKKTLFKRLEYGKVLALIFDHLNALLTIKNQGAEQLTAWLQDVSNKLKLSQMSQQRADFETDEEYWEACYAAAKTVISSDLGPEEGR